MPIDQPPHIEMPMPAEYQRLYLECIGAHRSLYVYTFPKGQRVNLYEYCERQVTKQISREQNNQE